MDSEHIGTPQEVEDEQPMADAPSPRAKALREEILGAALTLDEAAYVLSLDRTTVAKYLRESTLFGFQIGREWRVPEDELRAYVRRMIEGQTRTGEGADGEPRVRIIEESRVRVSTEPRNFIERIREDLFQERRKHGKGGRGGGGRFDKFTDRARRVMTLAQEEAQRLNHHYIGTEHLLLGLVREGEGVAAKVLANLGVELGKARGAVEHIIGRGDHMVSGEVGLTPRSKKVIELAVDEARRMGHHFIGTEHLLLGMVREGEGIAAGVLESLGIDLELARAQTLEVLAHYPRQADEEPTPPVPAAAASLRAAGEEGRACLRCAAHCPAYFRYCFNCGARLEGAAAPD